MPKPTNLNQEKKYISITTMLKQQHQDQNLIVKIQD